MKSFLQNFRLADSATTLRSHVLIESSHQLYRIIGIGYEIENNILYQDYKSTILLENNGKKSSSKRNRALNIHYFGSDPKRQFDCRILPYNGDGG
jgi:hypothetical protein